MNKPEEIERKLLEKLHAAWLTGRGVLDLHEIQKNNGWERVLFWNTVHKLVSDSIIKTYAHGGHYMISWLGIVKAEEAGLVAQEKLKELSDVRIAILRALAKLYDEKGTEYYDHYTQISEVTSIDPLVVMKQTDFLEDSGYLKSPADGAYHITEFGRAELDDYETKLALMRKFEDISALKPQPRGRALQKLLAKRIGQEGWEQEEGVKTSNEEMDVVVFQGRDFYLIECKWEKEPIEAPVIRELFGKLENRAAVNGVLFSMSGFTSGAVKQSEDYLNKRLILLFGPIEAKAIFSYQRGFGDLLNEKYNAMVMRRSVMWS
jgi:hypothetical protein